MSKDYKYKVSHSLVNTEKFIPITVFCLRQDSVTGLNEGEYYTNEYKGVKNCNLYSSPKLQDQQVYICVGKKAIKEGFERYELWLSKNSKA